MEDLILDFNLYLCEKFGYRNSCSVMQNANGFCVNIRERDLDCYIRFWEYSCGRGNFPDWSIIIVRSNFKKNQEESGSVLQRVHATLRLQIPLHRSWRLQILSDTWFETYLSRHFRPKQLWIADERFECLIHGLELRRGFLLLISIYLLFVYQNQNQLVEFD